MVLKGYAIREGQTFQAGGRTLAPLPPSCALALGPLGMGGGGGSGAFFFLKAFVATTNSDSMTWTTKNPLVTVRLYLKHS